MAMGGARVRSIPITLTCSACDVSFDHIEAGQLPHLCDGCRVSLRWCPRCEEAKSLDDFYASQKAGHPCRACCLRAPKVRTCASCDVKFDRTDRGGSPRTEARRKHLCDTCETSLKWCSTCDQVRPHEDFTRSADKRDGRVGRCTPCSREAYARRTHIDRRERIVRQYGLTVAEWDAMYLAQQGLCAICSQPPAPDSRGLVVDHDHATGEVRALLCGPCNLGLGQFADDAQRIRLAADYLDRMTKAQEAAR